MNDSLPTPPSFWRTVRLLLGAARKRATGRRRRQQQLLRNRTGRASSIDSSGFGFGLAVLLMALLNGLGAFVVWQTVGASQRLELERQGKFIVSRGFLEQVQAAERSTQNSSAPVDSPTKPSTRFFSTPFPQRPSGWLRKKKAMRNTSNKNFAPKWIKTVAAI